MILAAKKGEISPSVMKMITTKDNEKYFETKKETKINKILKRKNKFIIINKRDILAYITDTDTEGIVIRRVQKGK